MMIEAYIHKQHIVSSRENKSNYFTYLSSLNCFYSKSSKIFYYFEFFITVTLWVATKQESSVKICWHVSVMKWIFRKFNLCIQFEFHLCFIKQLILRMLWLQQELARLHHCWHHQYQDNKMEKIKISHTFYWQFTADTAKHKNTGMNVWMCCHIEYANRIKYSNSSSCSYIY